MYILIYVDIFFIKLYVIIYKYEGYMITIYNYVQKIIFLELIDE